MKIFKNSQKVAIQVSRNFNCFTFKWTETGVYLKSIGRTYRLLSKDKMRFNCVNVVCPIDVYQIFDLSASSV